MKIDADEKELLESVERGEWKSTGGGKRERARYARYAKATFRKDRRLNIRLSSKDLEAIQKRAPRGGSALPDVDLEPVAQVRLRPAQGGLTSADSSALARTVSEELGISLNPQRETRETAEIFNDLHVERSQHPLQPLFEGKWR
jgi:predicted DNA binding CopG/RHH family protein